MVWSFSSNRSFKKCQRQWFFKNHVASATAHDPYRRETFILSKLKSLSAWRGNIVDDVISNHIVPLINKKQPLLYSAILEIAHELFDEQLDFAKRKRVREPGMTQKKGGTAYAALYPIEYGEAITDEDLTQAWQDINQALRAFLQMDELTRMFRQSAYLVAQRALVFPCGSTSVKAVPDLIVFFSNKPPTIVDWKVHTYAMQNYRLQLASYALALTRCKPHKDFPPTLSLYKPTNINLLEVQLLTGILRSYALTDNDVEGVCSFIARTAREMDLAVSADTDEILTPQDFPPTIDPDECQWCPFRSLCWEM